MGKNRHSLKMLNLSKENQLSRNDLKNVVGGNAFQCPAGLCYNPIIMICDYPENGGCELGEVTCTIANSEGGYSFLCDKGSVSECWEYYNNECQSNPLHCYGVSCWGDF